MIDPSIALQVKPPVVQDPLDAYGRVMSLRNLSLQGQIGQQHLQEGDLKLQEARKTIADDETASKIFAKQGTTDQTLADLNAAGLQKYATAFGAQSRADATAKLTQEKTAMEVQAAKTKRFGDILSTVKDEPSYVNAVAQAVREGVGLTPEQTHGMLTQPYNPQEVDQLRQMAIGAQEVQKNKLADMEAGIKANAEARAVALAAPTLAKTTAEAQKATTEAGQVAQLGMTQKDRETIDRQKQANDATAAYQQGELKNSAARVAVEQQGQALKQKTFNATIGAGLDVNGQPKMGPDGKPVGNPLAAAMAAYQIPPIAARSMASPQGAALMREVLALNPTYDGTKFAQRNKIEQDFSASGASGKAITSTDTALAHLDAVSQAGKALKSKDIQLLNNIAGRLGAQVGSDPRVIYKSIVSTVAPEITRAVIGGVGEQSDRQKMEANFSPDLSDSQREGSIGATAGLLGARVHKQQQAYESDMGKPLSRKVSPESQAVLDRYTGGAKAGGGAQVTHKVGDTVMYNGKPHKITEVKANGKLVLEN